MSDNQFESRTATFSKSGTERSTSLQIENERKIGSGFFGVCYEADVTLGKHKRKFVIKRFSSARAEEEAANAMANHQEAKKAGLKVFTTYRLGEDGKSILMSNGNTDTNFCIGTNEDSPSIESLAGKKIEHIADEDLYKLAEEAFQQAVLAGNKDISLHADSLFYLVDRATLSKVGFVVGDLDHVHGRHASGHGHRTADNLREVYTGIKNFINKNMLEPEAYRVKVRDEYYSFIYHQGLTNI